MSSFIDQILLNLGEDSLRTRLKSNLHVHNNEYSNQIRDAAQSKWKSGLPPKNNSIKPAYAVDGSSRRANLASGATLLVAQALLLGEGKEQRQTEVQILASGTEGKTIDRFADLMRQSLEFGLARNFAVDAPPQSILYMDGALYGTLSQLYQGSELPNQPDYIELLLNDYHDLFSMCSQREIQLISISKTNRVPLISKILRGELGIPDNGTADPSDSLLFDECTNRSEGYSMPVLLGTHSFSSGWSAVPEYDAVKKEPAIVVFYVRLADMDDILRIDLPANCLGMSNTIGETDYEFLDFDVIVPVVEMLQSDYGGVQVYNALAYAVDLEVRLSKHKMYNVYLPLIEDLLGEELRIDRSERRFVD